MSRQTRELKKRKQSCERNRAKERYRESVVARVKILLRHLGVLDACRRARINLYALCPSCRFRRMTVRRSPTLSASPHTDGILRALQRVVDGVMCDLPGGYSCSLQEIITLVWPLLDSTYHTADDDEDVRNIKRAIRMSAVAEACLSRDLEERLRTILWDTLRRVLVCCGRIDSALYYLDFQKNVDDNRGSHLTLVLHRQEARVERVNIDGKPRSGYWCGLPVFPGGIEWITWKGDTLRMADANREYPVLVQQHALDRLYGRNGRLGFLAGHEAALQRSLWISLRHPAFHPSGRDDGSVLVEYRLGDHKLGYLVARGASNRVVVLTFLFLTMDCTPEGRELRRQLRLGRDDKTFLGFDSLDTFALTDVRTDRHLRSVLEKCGCGHLCEFGDNGLLVREGHADVMKEYLKLDAFPEMVDPASFQPSELRLWGMPVPVKRSSDGNAP